jgi:hypothetical protein
MADAVINNYCRGVWIPAQGRDDEREWSRYRICTASTVISGHSFFQRATFFS